MNYKEFKSKQNGGEVTFTQIPCPCPPNPISPPGVNSFNEGVPTTLKAEDYNGIPLADMEAMHKFKNLDQMTAADMIAADQRKGKALNAIAKVDGPEKFKSRYVGKN